MPENFLSFAKIMFGAFHHEGQQVSSIQETKKLVNFVLGSANHFLQQNICVLFEQTGPGVTTPEKNNNCMLSDVAYREQEIRRRIVVSLLFCTDFVFLLIENLI